MDDRMNWRVEEEICWDGPLVDKLFCVLPQIDAAKIKIRRDEEKREKARFRNISLLPPL